MRHAKSSWDDPRLADHARPLNPRGRRAAAAMRTAMRSYGLVPDVVLVSSARRTLQTLEQLEPWDETPLVEPMDALYLANAAQMCAVLNGVAETARSVLLIGHNPGLHELALMLRASPASGSEPMTNPPPAAPTATVTGAQAIAGALAGDHARLAEGFPTGALAEFTIAGPWWSLGARGGRLMRFVVPRDLPDRAG